MGGKISKIRRKKTREAMYQPPVEKDKEGDLGMGEYHEYASMSYEGEPNTEDVYVKPVNDTITLEGAVGGNIQGQAPKYKLVIALDFGTTYSGYCYAHVADNNSPPEMHLDAKFGGEVGAAQYKMPTCVCVKEKAFYSMGFKAQSDYNQAVYEYGLKLFENFKMELYNKKGIDRNFMIESQNGMKMKAMDIFSMAIKYMKDHCLNVIKDANRFPGFDKILWVLTVPAIWGDPEKMFMREAAIQAGIITNINDEKLVVALEPEAASICCRRASDVPLHTEYMIIDAGGGTIDITSYKCLPAGASAEIYQPSGGDWGGNYVNKNFEKLLSRSVFDPSFVNKCRKENSTVWHELMSNFEQAKRRFKNDSKAPIPITISMAFADCVDDYYGKRIKIYFQEKAIDGIKIGHNGHLQIDVGLMKSFFDSVIDDIVSHIKELLLKRQLQNVKTLFLVGGFAQCDYLQHRITSAIKKLGRQVIIPEEPVLAILKGAVWYGCNPILIRSRISPRTYSFAAYKGKNNAVKYLSQVVEKGDSVNTGHYEERYCEPLTKHMDEVKMELYACDSSFNENPDDPGNYEVGVVVVKVPKTFNNRVVQFTFTFGGTEIKIKGKHNASGSEGKTTISCLAPRGTSNA